MTSFVYPDFRSVFLFGSDFRSSYRWNTYNEILPFQRNRATYNENENGHQLASLISTIYLRVNKIVHNIPKAGGVSGSITIWSVSRLHGNDSCSPPVDGELLNTQQTAATFQLVLIFLLIFSAFTF